MRRPVRRRWLGPIAVIAAITGSAYAQLVVTSGTAATNGSIPQSSPGTIVFSIRNTSGGTLDITGFAQQTMALPGPGCSGVSISLLGNPGNQAVTLMPNQQAQFVATTTNGFTMSPADCTWDIQTNPLMAPAPTVTTEFLTSVSPGSANVQPTVMSFGSQSGSFETQKLVVQNTTGSGGQTWATIYNDTTNKFSFIGSCSGHDCFFGLPSPPATSSLDVRCQAGFMSDSNSAMLAVYTSGSAGSNLLGQTQLDCNAFGNNIQIANKPLSIFPQFNQTASTIAQITTSSGSGTMSGASLTSADSSFQFLDADCSGTTCAFTPTARTLPSTLTIECRGGAIQTNATLVVYAGGSGSGSSTMDQTNVTCASMGSPGVLNATPSPLDFMHHDVGTTTMLPLTLSNSGGSAISNVVITPPASADWSVTQCTQASPCFLGAGSASFDVTVPVTFRPMDLFDRSSSLTVSGSGVAPITVNLDGIGDGGDLDVTAPPGPPYALDFGTIPKGQPFTRTLTLSNSGNKTLMATVDGVTAPYSIAPAGTQPILVNTPKSFTVTCQSSTASSSNDQTISVTSDAVHDATASVAVKCKIADTSIQVDPQQFDFGEVRTGSPTQTLTVTVTNPAASSGPAHITRLALADQRTGLTLVPPSTDVVLQPGQSTTATLQLTTAVDSVLDGEFLDIDVDAAALTLPVTGKVVTAHSQVVPDSLDLGTACVGSTVDGEVMLINDGTATLSVDPPQMDMSFVAAGPAGTTYPASLPPAASMTATVSPAMSTTGPIAGMLTWHNDEPKDHHVPVKLEYITTGTAISPATMNFGSVAVDASALPQHVTIENCDLASTTVTIKAITTMSSPVGAWVIEPRLGYTKTLPAHATQAITVTFRPPARGRYEADLEVETSIGNKRIHLVGDATGRDFDNTSFYACACETPTSPARGWPILLAVVVIIVRRRRGSSSAR